MIFGVPDGCRPRPILLARAQARLATRHNRGIQTYKGQAGRQSAMLFDRAAWFERSLRKAAAVAGIDWDVRTAWTKRCLKPKCPRHPSRALLCTKSRR